MLDFGKHTAFVLSAYGVSGLGILVLIIYSYMRGRNGRH